MTAWRGSFVATAGACLSIDSDPQRIDDVVVGRRPAESHRHRGRHVFGSFAGPIVSFDKFATWNYVPTAMYPNAVRNAFAFAGNDVFVVGDTGIVHYGN